jgi:hypothetical protein
MPEGDLTGANGGNGEFSSRISGRAGLELREGNQGNEGACRERILTAEHTDYADGAEGVDMVDGVGRGGRRGSGGRNRGRWRIGLWVGCRFGLRARRAGSEAGLANAGSHWSDAPYHPSGSPWSLCALWQIPRS